MALGEMIKIRLRAIGKTPADMARGAVLGRATVDRLLEGDRNPRPLTLKAAAEFLGWSYDPVKNKIVIDGAEYPVDVSLNLLPLDHNVGPIRPFDDPLDLGEADVAASHFTDSQIGLEATDAERAGHIFIHFTIRIHGDCMAPAWMSGERVLFRRMRDGMDFYAIGADYYIERRDEGATFKRLIALDDGTITIQSIAAPGKQWVIPRVDILNSALAVGRMVG